MFKTKLQQFTDLISKLPPEVLKIVQSVELDWKALDRGDTEVIVPMVKVTFKGE